MRIFTIHLGPVPEAGEEAGPALGGRELVLVKEGFSWPAFFLSALWALYHRMWLTAALLVAAGTGLSWVLETYATDEAVSAVVSLGYLWLVGASANDWRRASLRRRGYEEAGVVAGYGMESAQHRAVDRLGPGLRAGA